jgi:hypothetical protein
MVGAAGIEPATTGLEIRCSIRLSYAPSTTYGRSGLAGGRFGGSWDRGSPYRKLTTKTYLRPAVSGRLASRSRPCGASAPGGRSRQS